MRKNAEIQKWIEENTDKHLCECGCGLFVKPTKHRYYRGKLLRFIAGHQNRGKYHPNFKGGKRIAKGYMWILIQEHPRRTPRGYVKRSWLVVEKALGRYLEPGEVVHHINGDKLDDRPENLEITTSRKHASAHNDGSGNSSYRHDIDTERDILPLVRQKVSQRQIAKRLGCSHGTVKRRLRKYRASL